MSDNRKSHIPKGFPDPHSDSYWSSREGGFSVDAYYDNVEMFFRRKIHSTGRIRCYSYILNPKLNQLHKSFCIQVNLEGGRLFDDLEEALCFTKHQCTLCFESEEIVK